MSMKIASEIVGLINNYNSNIALNSDIREVPYYVSFLQNFLSYKVMSTEDYLNYYRELNFSNHE